MTSLEAILPSDAVHPYRGVRAALATMHGKERAIAPSLRASLGMELIVPPDIDTDQLGTFTGEIARKGAMADVAVEKARLGIRSSGLSLGFASEGSFGPHPVIPFLVAGIETLVFVDDGRRIVIRETMIDESPCFHHAIVETDDELDAFLKTISFPDHAVIVKPNDASGGFVAKGITERKLLSEAIEKAAHDSDDGLALIQTDMRAHLNPTRMASLSRLARQMADRLSMLCPACGVPGFGRIATELGLPCSWCSEPSNLAKGEVLGCPLCDYRALRPRSDGLTAADPAFCPLCNP